MYNAGANPGCRLCTPLPPGPGRLGLDDKRPEQKLFDKDVVLNRGPPGQAKNRLVASRRSLLDPLLFSATTGCDGLRQLEAPQVGRCESR